MNWIKANAATVITWVLLGLAAASTVGAHASSFKGMKDEVATISKKVKAHDTQIGTMRGDVRILKGKQTEIVDETKSFRATITELNRVVGRLEAVVGVLKRGQK